MRKKAQTILNALDCPDGELSILIVDDLQIEKLNREYLSRYGPTNVLAFPMREGDFEDLNPQLLGDIVISIETAAKEGSKMGIPMEERISELLVHGILHLFGYDHEVNEQDAHEMEKKSRQLLELTVKEP
jgi:probable rRNA maturation factor